MTRYLIRRFIFSLFAIWATVTLTFFFMRLLPGDPVTTLVGSEGDPSTIEGIKSRLGLNQPVPIQYLYYVRAIEAPSPAVDADPLGCTRDESGRCVELKPCSERPVDDDCLSLTEERAWSSPIFVNRAP